MNEAAVRSKAQAESRIQELMLEKSQTEESLQKSSNEAQAEVIRLKQSQEAAKSENEVW